MCIDTSFYYRHLKRYDFDVIVGSWCLKFWHVLQLRNNDCWLSSFLRITAYQRPTNGVLIHLTLLIVMLMLVTPATLMNKLFLFTMVSLDLSPAPRSSRSVMKGHITIWKQFCGHLYMKRTFVYIFVTCQRIWRTFKHMYFIIPWIYHASWFCNYN